jgi:hypothetical protein
MQVFISWSKETSLSFAKVLRNWLPDVIQQVHPWVSKVDIDKGERWAAELSEKLDGLTEGLICVTAENQREPRLNFEAGALARSLGRGRVRPILLGIDPTEVTGPLSTEDMTREVLRLVRDVWRSGVANPPRRRRSEPSRAVHIDGMAYDSAAFHPEYGPGRVLKMLPDLPAYVLVDFKDQGPNVVLVEDLVLPHGLLF